MKKAVHIPKALSDEALQKAPQQGKRLLEPLKAFSVANGAPIHILENVDQSNPPEIHVREADLWIVLKGNPTFTVGGAMIGATPQTLPDGTLNDMELTGTSIEGGTDYTLSPGDMLYIPAGDPHSHKAVGTVRMYIIKIREA
ncbi:MAG: cupin domain-containing protein [Candidatus Pacebacteria bacterium]|nr:cupin domain-containing protein [Candidatus Paceibacterota bacterium]